MSILTRGQPAGKHGFGKNSLQGNSPLCGPGAIGAIQWRSCCPSSALDGDGFEGRCLVCPEWDSGYRVRFDMWDAVHQLVPSFDPVSYEVSTVHDGSSINIRPFHLLSSTKLSQLLAPHTPTPPSLACPPPFQPPLLPPGRPTPPPRHIEELPACHSPPPPPTSLPPFSNWEHCIRE